MTEGRRDQLQAHLFSRPDHAVYAVLDGASAAGLLALLQTDVPHHACLFSGALHPEVAETAPYLVRLEREAPFTDWVLRGWGQHLGIFALVDEAVGFKAVRTHFRRFLMVRGPDNEPLYFRYYDPRVLRVYLPSCNAEEAEVLFGPAQWYMLEGEDPSTLCTFSADEHGPQCRETSLAAPAFFNGRAAAGTQG